MLQSNAFFILFFLRSTIRVHIIPTPHRRWRASATGALFSACRRRCLREGIGNLVVGREPCVLQMIVCLSNQPKGLMARGPGGKVNEVRHLETAAPPAPLRRHAESIVAPVLEVPRRRWGLLYWKVRCSWVRLYYKILLEFNFFSFHHWIETLQPRRQTLLIIPRTRPCWSLYLKVNG